jgi:hypothetical protein
MMTADDASSAAFTRVFPRHSRTGLNRPDMNVAAMSLMSRTIPDYVCEEGFVEVMGIGRDQTLKLKVEKALALTAWRLIEAVDLFVYDSHRKRWWRAPIHAWVEACAQHADTDRFHENQKLYWRLHTDNFPTEPTAVPRSN